MPYKNSFLDYDDPHSIIVLAEEELVAIDLQSEGWQCYKQPYLWSLHSSAITCAAHNANVPEALWNKICDAGEQQMNNFTARVRIIIFNIQALMFQRIRKHIYSCPPMCDWLLYIDLMLIYRNGLSKEARIWNRQSETETFS